MRIGLGIDSLEAGDWVDGAVTDWSFMETQTLRVVYETPSRPEGFIGGPCQYNVDRDADDGCAWQERGAPNVGDEARAMKSETLESTALSAVAFARENVFADIEVVARGDSDAPNHFADDIAKAVDKQIKLALSQ